MRWLTMLCALTLLTCGDDPGYNNSQFASELAKVSCDWIFACCDSAEQLVKANNATTKSDCIAQKTAGYITVYQSADAKSWNAQSARDCVLAVESKGAKCPRAFDPDTEVGTCQFVLATKKPGDFCSNRWECTTKFCKNGVCANPLADGMACQVDEPCASPLRCANGKCGALKVDGSSCVAGDECYTGACVAGVCKVVPTYTCDGQG